MLSDSCDIIKLWDRDLVIIMGTKWQGCQSRTGIMKVIVARVDSGCRRNGATLPHWWRSLYQQAQGTGEVDGGGGGWLVGMVTIFLSGCLVCSCTAENVTDTFE